MKKVSNSQPSTPFDALRPLAAFTNILSPARVRNLKSAADFLG